MPPVLSSGFPTPETLPSETVCRTLVIPNETVFLACVMGALRALAEEENWQLTGAITPEEAAAAAFAMIDASYESACGVSLPGPTPIFRLHHGTGAIEELLPDGTWGEPAGDYAIPATPAREEATADERMCLAAANAANVLQILYENLSDSFNSELSYDAAVAAFVAAIAGAIGSVFGILVTPLIVIFAVLFGVVYATVEFVAADLWDEAFTAKLVCALLKCATDTDAVVHFDMQCVLEELAHGTNILDLTVSEIRLFGQIYVILNFLGAQALDASGATATITTYDCSACAPAEGCFEVSYYEENNPLSSYIFIGEWATYDQHNLNALCVGSDAILKFNQAMTDNTETCPYTRIEADIEVYTTGADYHFGGMNVLDLDTNDVDDLGGGTVSAGAQTVGVDVDGTSYYGIRVELDQTGGCGTGDVRVNAVRIYSSNIAAAGLTPNC